MTGARPAISVVVATCDRPALLADALASVARQSLAPLEVRVGDDGTQDLSAALGTLGTIANTRVASGAGQAGIARNRAAAGARGDLLAFLDDDDRWLPSHLEGLARAFEDPAVAFAYRDCAVVRERVDEDGARRDLARRVIAREWDEVVMRRDDYLPPSAWALRREHFERLEGFDPGFRYSEDWDFVLRAAALAIPRRVPGVTVEVRMRESGNTSAEFTPERIACLERLARRHGLPPLTPRTFWEVAGLVGDPEQIPWPERS